MLTRQFLTVKDVADLVRVSEATVRHWIRLRELRAIDLGREWRVIPRDLEAFLATHETCGTIAAPGGLPAGLIARPGEPGSPGQEPEIDSSVKDSRGAARATTRGLDLPESGSDKKARG